MRFLIVDDDPAYRTMLRYHLEVEWPDALITEYQPVSAGLPPEAFALGGIDLVLLSHPVDKEKGAELSWLRMLRGRRDCPPVILFAEHGDEFLAVDALRVGAASYFPKSKVSHRRLVEAIRGAVRQPPGGRTPRAIAAEAGRPEVLKGLKRHRFIARLHAGDLTTVYLAQAEDSGQRFACKVLRHVPDTGGGQLFDRFLQEYEVIARVQHPHVVQISDLGIADDHAYIVMEYLSNGNLARRLRKALAPEHALANLAQIASALHAIHSAGVLHRDLKPANIMFRDDETLALIDFGLAKQILLEAAITGTGQIFGTPYYMSPEQGHAAPTDQRSDLYSVGCIFYEMLTGQRPFVASSPMAVIYQHAHAPRPRLPGDLQDWQPLLDRLFAIDPAERYQSASELLDALEALRPVSVRGVASVAERQ
jgi:DNA-binding response OmpR family regulator